MFGKPPLGLEPARAVYPVQPASLQRLNRLAFDIKNKEKRGGVTLAQEQRVDWLCFD
jgi:hypothetical protein